MISDLSETIESAVQHVSADSDLPFSEYVADCRALIKARRRDLQLPSPYSGLILNANSPFELKPLTPNQSSHSRIGALLVHGLFDCPFSFRDIGADLQSRGILSRAILLPGHGTIPDDLLQVTYQDWINTVQYGVASLKKTVDKIFIFGYSTGAALAAYHAARDENIAGIVLLAPCFKVKAPVNIMFTWHNLTKSFSRDRRWLYQNDEVDYAKYQSVGFEPVRQVDALTKCVTPKLCKDLNCPIFIAISEDDETISCKAGLAFFDYFKHQKSEVLLYSASGKRYHDSRITVRNSHYPQLQIKNFSHVALINAPNNSHYGQHGDYAYASHVDATENLYGAYNHIESNLSDSLYRLNLSKQKRRLLTYNPDFDFMTDRMYEFITRCTETEIEE